MTLWSSPERLRSWQHEEHMHEEVINRQKKMALIEYLFKMRAPRLPCWFHAGRWLRSWLPLLHKSGGSFPGKRKTENLGTMWNETQLRAGIPHWIQGTEWKLPNALPLWPSTILLARPHPPGRRSEDPFLETKRLKREGLKIPPLEFPRKRPELHSLQSKKLHR